MALGGGRAGAPVARLPHGVQPPDGRGPAPPRRLQPDQVLRILVGEDAGLAHQTLVSQLSARQLLVNGLQAQQKGTVAKPAVRALRLRPPLQVACPSTARCSPTCTTGLVVTAQRGLTWGSYTYTHICDPLLSTNTEHCTSW